MTPLGDNGQECVRLCNNGTTSVKFCCVRDELCGPCVTLADLDAKILETEALLENAKNLETTVVLEDAKILETEARLEELKQSQRVLRTEMNRIHDPLIQQVPTEIASYIFTHVCGCAHPYPGPLALASVCRRWREISFFTPQIWTTFELLRSDKEWDFPLILAEQWLARSGQLPLDISLYWDPAPSESVLSTMETMIELICAHSNRWKCLTLAIPHEVFPFFRSDVIVNSNLESLELFCTDNEPLTMITPFWPANISLCPKKAQLYSIPPTHVRLDWENIMELSISRVTSNQAVWALQQCPRIENLSLSFTTNDGPAPTIPLFLRKLTFFRYTSYLNHSDDFINILMAPALCKLEGVHVVTQADIIPLTSMLKRSACSLTDLKMNCHSMGLINEEDLVNLLYDLPCLEALSLDFELPVFPNGGTLFRQFLICPTTGGNIAGNAVTFRPFLPRLESFTYLGHVCFPWNTLATLYQIHSASRPTTHLEQNSEQFQNEASPRPLHSLRIFTPNPRSDEDLIDRQSLLRFFQLPENNMKMILNPRLMKASIEHHHLTPDGNVASFYRLPSPIICMTPTKVENQ